VYLNNAVCRTQVEDGTTNINDMVPLFAHCCTITSLYCPDKVGKMCGCFTQGQFLCMEGDCTCCKVAENTPDACCICQKVRLTMIKPVTCVQVTSQFFCCDHRCALPCDKDVPCMFTVLGLTCFYDYKFNCTCWQTIASMKPPPPPQQNRF
jgi:hypothetical protein